MLSPTTQKNKNQVLPCDHVKIRFLARKNAWGSTALGLFLAFNGRSPQLFAHTSDLNGNSETDLDYEATADHEMLNLLSEVSFSEKCINHCHDKSHDKSSGGGSVSIGRGSHSKSHSKEVACKLFDEKRSC